VTLTSQRHLGDSHNFGRRVSVGAERVRKPRTLLWEWVLLSPDSPLRQFFAEAAQRDGLGPDAFSFLPDLSFFPSPPHDGPEGGEVERIALDSLVAPSDDRRRALARIVGRSIALFSWLGVSDLHWENLALGVGPGRRLVFAPLDVEIILSDLSLPTETKLLPDADPEYAAVCRHACGARRVLPYLGKPVDVSDLLAMAGAYRGTLGFLDRHAGAIADVFARLPGLRTAPIRVCLRGTDDYARAGSEPLWPPLLDAEEEQLRRGDVPYFFRWYGRPGIRYFGDPTLRQIHTLPRKGDVPQLDPMLNIARGLRTPSRKNLRDEGLITLLGAFDHPSLTGAHKNDELEVMFQSRTLVVKLPTGEELRSRRNLSAFVGSVYLPCRCGEVRSVFVPPVTVCDAP
jgi:hypothetical protein